jgi:N-methylhydantoinase A/oxoprolinase/acetone carboxylase beta subunit
VRPTVATYVKGLQSSLKDLGTTCDVNILRSDAGLMTTTEAQRNPIYGVLSGPSGGVAGALHVATKAGYPNILTFDMGGTSTDVALCQNGEPTIGRETSISHFRIKIPSVNVHTVGAGGGSIAHVPQLTGALRVGPQSAGAEPGPAAYGKGGEEPTVTDANVVVGHLPPRLLGGEMTLDVEGARAAVQKIADAMSLSLEQAADGILSIVNENMAGALRLVSVQRGHDPRDFALVAFGGAGPLHANAVAKLMGSFQIRMAMQWQGLDDPGQVRPEHIRSADSRLTAKLGGEQRIRAGHLRSRNDSGGVCPRWGHQRDGRCILRDHERQSVRHCLQGPRGWNVDGAPRVPRPFRHDAGWLWLTPPYLRVAG